MLSYALNGWSTTDVLLVTTVVITTAYVALRKNGKHSTKCGLPLPPSLPSLPIVGTLPVLLGEDPAAYFMKQTKRLGKVFSLYAGSR